ncbi:histidine kinase [Bacteroides xylanisolvens]|uniref:histidine kinase n=1 Tax=Bacteroides xylanisolvens TaxID=371601 RepID=UPI0022E3DD5E|nr:histidine kinase [Bacteroides xylanisolvens]
MKALIYITIFLMSGICFTSCKTSRNMETQKQVDYSGELSHIQSIIESLRADVSKQTKITTDKLSDLKIENKTVYLSAPDSSGKQYPVKESTTKASKQEQERTKVDEILSITLQQFSNRLDTISNKVNALLNQREKIIELSWWDLHRMDVFAFFFMIIILGIICKIKEKYYLCRKDIKNVS